LGDGRFEPVAITLGPEIGELTVVTEGLSEGQKVVASSQFLLDSEASLTGGYAEESPVRSTAPIDSEDATGQTGDQP
jgi:Cu(I)/Ag(I) efflux system membrane fusion protein